MEPRLAVPNGVTAEQTSGRFGRGVEPFAVSDATDLTTMTASEIIAWYAAYKLTIAERRKRAAPH